MEARNSTLDEPSCSISCVTSTPTLRASNVTEERRKRSRQLRENAFSDENSPLKVESQVYVLLFAFSRLDRQVLLHMLRKSCNEEAVWSTAYRFFHMDVFRRYALENYRSTAGMGARAHRVRKLLRLLRIADRSWTHALNQLVASLKALGTDDLKSFRKFLGNEGPGFTIQIRGYNHHSSSRRSRLRRSRDHITHIVPTRRMHLVPEELKGLTMMHTDEEVYVVADSLEHYGELEVVLKPDVRHVDVPSNSCIPSPRLVLL